MRLHQIRNNERLASFSPMYIPIEASVIVLATARATRSLLLPIASLRDFCACPRTAPASLLCMKQCLSITADPTVVRRYTGRFALCRPHVVLCASTASRSTASYSVSATVSTTSSSAHVAVLPASRFHVDNTGVLWIAQTSIPAICIVRYRWLGPGPAFNLSELLLS